VGITQAELAKRAGFATVFISMLEREKRRPVRATVAQLAAALEIPAARRAALEAAAHLSSTKRAAIVVDNHLIRPRLVSGGFLGAKPEGALVARDVELERLRAIMASVTDGVGHLALLAGEPGVGKTRLAQEVDLIARGRGFLAITGCCYEQNTAMPYSPYIEALASLYAAVADAIHAKSPGQWGELTRLLRNPAADAPDETAGAPSAGGREDQSRLFWQVSSFLQMLAEEQPVALLLDDLQWADQASIDLLRHLARHTATSPILLLGAYRDDEVDERHPLEEALRVLAHDHLAERIYVRSLSLAGTQSLIAATLGEAAASEEFARVLHHRTEGNAFFTQEVMRTLVENGDIVQGAGALDTTAVKRLTIPDTIRSGLAKRFRRLSPSTQTILHEASVLGQTFSFDDLQAMSNQSESDVEDALEAGISARLLDEMDDERVGFHHAFVHDTLYHDLTAHRRRTLHRKAGEAIERLPERMRIRRSADLAYHFRAAGAGARALPYLLLAGDQAEAVYAHTEAERFYRSAAEIAHDLGDQAHGAAALEKLGDIQYFIARFESAIETYNQASRAYRETGDVMGLRRVTARLTHAYAEIGEVARGRALLQSLLDSTPGDEPASSVAEMYIYMAWLRTNPLERLAACERAADIARANGDNHILALAEFSRGNILIGPMGRVDEARQVFEEIIPFLEASGDLRRLCSTCNVIADAYMRGGEFGVAREWVERALEVTQRLGLPAQLASTWCNRGDVAWHIGDWQQAYLDYKRAEATYGRANLVAESGYAFWGMGQVLLARGQIREASRLLEEAIIRAEPHANQEFEALQAANMALAERDLLAEHSKFACTRLERLVERFQGMPGLVMRVLPLLAWAHLDLGASDKAASLVQDAVTSAKSGRQRVVLVEGLRIKGVIAASQEQWTEGEAALKEALILSQAMPYPYAEAKIHYTLGQLHSNRNELEAACAHLQAARNICKRLGERLYRAHIVRRLTIVERSRMPH
jgi:tetratricopeptide (TPR) repeat protein/transcriptional regulator with XRE-family HTH domain